MGQAIAADANANIYVAGSYPFTCEGGLTDYELLIIKYNANGSQLWTGSYQEAGSPVQVEGAALDDAGTFYLAADFTFSSRFVTLTYATDGGLNWISYLTTANNAQSHGIVIDFNENSVVTGQINYQWNGALNVYSYYYGTFMLNTNGNPVWTNDFPQPPLGSSVANAIAVDKANSSYVTGYSSGPNGTNNIVTIKYGPNGNQLWLQSYNGLNAGNDAGNAIAVDKNGNVYVTGYETLTGGGTGIVTIKYIPISIQRQTNGTVLIETQGTPGESFDIQASSDLLNWLDLGSVLADTNGLMQFDDTNAPNFPARFYYTNPK